MLYMFSGVAVGTGMAGMEEIAETGSAFREKGYNKVSPFFLLKVLTNMPAGQISIRHGFKVCPCIFQTLWFFP